MDDDRIACPAPVQTPPRAPFPFVAALAPVLVSGLLWAITRSPFAVVFAALGPIVAIGGLLDSRWSARRHARREAARFAEQVARATALVHAAHARERADLEARAPTAGGWLERPDHDPDRWRADPGTAALVLGRGRVSSRVSLDEGAPSLDRDPRIAELAQRAGSLDDAPIVVHGGVAIAGAAPLAHAVARGLTLQLAVQLAPARHRIVVGRDPAAWVTALPHPLEIDERVPAGELRFRGHESELAIAVIGDPGRAPARCRTVVVVGARTRVVRHDDRALVGPIEPELVSAATAGAWAARLSTLAAVDAEALARAEPPRSVALADLASVPRREGTLAAPLGRRADGSPCIVDLMRDGPHAVVGGTTGSGKSELLIAWVLALAERYRPDEVDFLLVDFKGGASFGALQALPHCVGVISDLGAAMAVRALASLRAEMQRREAAIAAAGGRSLDDVPGVARLVIVVDEFAAMVADHPDLHALFSDIAARGRSLGMHLVLCTQRPAGVVRDGVLANADLRISLRVNNRADSVAVVGTDAAAALAAASPGRAVVSIAGAEPEPVQVALATDADARRIAADRSGPAPHRPWLDPLPAVIRLAELGRADGVRLGRLDEPLRQAQPVAVWRPEVDGHLLTLGSARSGRSNLLAVIAAEDPRARVLPADPEGAWDVVVALADAVEHGERVDTLLLVDDVDALLARMPDEHALALAEALGTILRSGAGVGARVALTAQRVIGPVASIAALCDVRVVLRMPSRQEHLMTGAPAELFDASAPPGRGMLGDRPVQIALADTALPVPPRREPCPIDLAGPLALVAPAPDRVLGRARLRRLDVASVTREAIGDDTVVVGDPTEWQAAWGVFPRLAARMPVLFAGCSVADIRSLTRSRTLPPPMLPGRGGAVLMQPDGSMRRVLPRFGVDGTDSAASAASHR